MLGRKMTAPADCHGRLRLCCLRASLHFWVQCSSGWKVPLVTFTSLGSSTNWAIRNREKHQGSQNSLLFAFCIRQSGRQRTWCLHVGGRDETGLAGRWR